MRPSLTFLESRSLLSIVLLGVLGWSLWEVGWTGPIIHTGGGGAALEFLRSLFSPDLSPSFLKLAIVASWYTVAYAVAGITLAVALGLPLGVVASGVLARSPVTRWSVVLGTRGFLAAIRSVHELVWAWLFVAAIGLSPMAAILALGDTLRRHPGPHLLGDSYRRPGATASGTPGLGSVRGEGADVWTAGHGPPRYA